MKVHFICNKDIVHNGVSYKAGQAWDGDPPAPQVGGDWTIRQDDEQDDPHSGGVGASASKGSVRWKPQPARPRAQPLTEAERKQLELNPYSNLDVPESAPSPPPGREKKAAAIAPFERTPAEIDDPFGLKSRAAARAEELQEDQEEE